MIIPQKSFMRLAIEQANQAKAAGDYAIGAVVVQNDVVLSSAMNRSKLDENPTSHAETLAITAACAIQKTRHLQGAVLYTTHEPCTMCASVAVWATLSGVVFGARYQDMKEYQARSANEHYLWRTIDISCEEVFQKSHEHIELVKDFMRGECLQLFHSD